MTNIFSTTVQLRRVVVTGMGAVTPIGNNLADFWHGLTHGKNGADTITRFDAGSSQTRIACEVKGFDPAQYFGNKEANRMDLFTQFAMVAAEQAIHDTKFDATQINGNDVGVIWASGIGGFSTLQEEIIAASIRPGRAKFSPYLVPKIITDIAAGSIAIKYGFRGPNYCTVSACSSSTHALIDSFNLIRLGQAKMIVTGGSEAPMSMTGVGGFNAMRALSTRNDDPKTASRPCDADRDGFVLGEGAGAIILEDLEHALARSAPIYAEMIGGGAAADAYHITAPHPEGLGARLAMERCLRDARIRCQEIDHINAHATSTPVGDLAEMRAIADVFGDHLHNVDISATKSMTGHLLGAAGAIEAAACIMSVRHDRLPLTINLETPDSMLDSRLKFTSSDPRRKIINTALSTNFGFGGHNAVVVFRKFGS